MTQTIENVSVGIAVNLEEVHGKVDRGVTLRRLIEEHTKELDEIKAYLREAASSGAFPVTETGTVEIRSPETENCAQVIPCKDTPVIIVGKDLTALKAQLTSGEFTSMFREVIVMESVPKFETTFNAATKKVQNIVRKFVSWRPNASQVRFSK